MGGIVSGIGGAVSGVLGGIGANKAAKQQQKAQDEAMNQQREGYQSATSWMTPYETAGQTGLAGLQNLAGQPIDRNVLLTQFYKSPEYAQMANAGRYQQMAAAEATGGLGSTATSNGLSALSATLGQNYLADMTNQQQTMYSQLMGLSGLGAQSANALGNWAMNQGNTMAGMEQQKGQILAGKSAIPWQTAASANSSISNGASQDLNSFGNMFSSFGGLF